MTTIERDLRALRRVRVPHGFADAVLAETGLIDRYARASSPVGDVFIAYNPAGISAVERVGPGFEERLVARTGRRAVRVPGFPPPLARAIERRFAGDRVRPRFDLRGLTPFRRSVLLKALDIPFGEVRPYGWIAREIGAPAAVRAVGSALGSNPVPLLIPCHRVVRGDGSLGEYSMGGPSVKRKLLDAEGALAVLERTHAPVVGSDTTKIFCYPTCRHARRVTPAHNVVFGSLRDARDRGYRPCKICRPG